MKVGDKVRLLRGTEEGRIVNIKNDKLVEIEIEDGFLIPALISEIVAIDSSEADNFEKEQLKTESTNIDENPTISNGIYIGFKRIDQENFDAFIINQSNDQILYSISQNHRKVFAGKASGICKEFESNEIGSFTSGIFNESRRIHIQIIVHEIETRIIKAPIIKELIIEKKQFEEKEFVRSVGQELTLINLQESIPLHIDSSEIRNSMLSGSSRPAREERTQPLTKEDEVDLHFDSGFSKLSPSEILEQQLYEFEKAYDNALVMNLQKLKVIHGIGAGILRNEIHKRLSKKPEVKFFEDADKERFGFGSTIIYF